MSSEILSHRINKQNFFGNTKDEERKKENTRNSACVPIDWSIIGQGFLVACSKSVLSELLITRLPISGSTKLSVIKML